MFEPLTHETHEPDRPVAGAFDPVLLLTVVTLVLGGVVMVYSASFQYAQDEYGSGLHFLTRQAIFAAAGLLAMLLLMRTDYHKLVRPGVVYSTLGVSLVLLILVLIPGIGATSHGARRWIPLGPVALQPSEVAKLAVILFLAYGLVDKRGKMKSFWLSFFPHILFPGVLVVLMLQQPDFGYSALLAGVVLVMLMVGGAAWRHLAAAGLAGVVAGAILIGMAPYRLKRVTIFLDPWKDRFGDGYAIIQSLIAMGSGGLIGRGFAEGRQKMLFLPEIHTDYLLACIGEEFGLLLGTVPVLLAFAVFIVRGLRIAWYSADPHGAFLACGITLMLGLQAFLHAGVVMAVLPPKGLTLPFLSYGGSSLVSSMAMAGILLSVSSRCHFPIREGHRPRARRPRGLALAAKEA